MNFASMTATGRVLEIGTFTGYAAACFLERDARAFDVAAMHLGIMESFGLGEEARHETQRIREEGEVPHTNYTNLAFTYLNARCQLLKVDDALATLEEIAAYPDDFGYEPFDLVFLDADKPRLL